MGQLVKLNSIKGSKQKSVQIVYTPAYNLKKTSDMDVGSVSFKNNKIVKRFYIDKDKDSIKDLLKSKQESYPDL